MVTQFGIPFYERGGDILERNYWDFDPHPSRDCVGACAKFPLRNWVLEQP